MPLIRLKYRLHIDLYRYQFAIDLVFASIYRAVSFE